jgi:hypothetical protein
MVIFVALYSSFFRQDSFPQYVSVVYTPDTNTSCIVFRAKTYKQVIVVCKNQIIHCV